MASNTTIDYSKLYRLPFSKNDNFNGWIEITTHCNIKCPGCYRGCDDENHRGEHKSLEAVKEEILKLKKIRNATMISISGGEPLLHPSIDEIVQFVYEQKMHPSLFTNGVLLTEIKLNALKNLGLTAVFMRMDSLQDQHIGMSEIELHEKRDAIANLCAKVGVTLALTCCIAPENLKQVPDVITWAEKNHTKVDQLTLILKRQLAYCKEDIEPNDSFVFLEDLISTLHTAQSNVVFSSYLGSDQEIQQAKWLQSIRFIHKREVIGYADKRFAELLQVVYHYFTGSYLSVLKKQKNSMNILQLLVMSVVSRCITPVIIHFFKKVLCNPLNIFAKVSTQAITVVVPPHFVNGKRDLCDACPDAIFYKGTLVPSCALEEIKKLNKTFEYEISDDSTATH